MESFSEPIFIAFHIRFAAIVNFKTIKIESIE